MATVSRGEITITNVDDGKPGETYYPHRGYLMADGTFTNVYPNENLLDNPYTTTGVSWDSQVPTAPNNFEVGNYSPYTYLLRYGMGSLNEVLKTGDVITISFDIEMEVGTRISVYDSNSSQKYTIGSENFTNIGTEKTRLSFTKTVAENGKGGGRWTLEFYNGNNGDKFSISNLKIEYGEVATPYTPSPNVDYENAYPKYEGFYSDTNQVGSDNPDDYKPWTPFMGPQGGQGPKGDSVPLISLSGATQAITVDKDGKITPASSFAVNGTAVNTAISNWTYSLNGGNFGSAVPTGVTRSGNTVTIDPTKAVFDTFTIKAADATVSDVFTISRIKDGGEGPPGSDAYTVFLTNESYTFAGSTTAALAGSTTTEVIVYKGINKITPTSITVGTKPTGLSSSVSGSVITLTATTALVSKSGTVPITIIADGKTFTKQFAYALSLQGGKGDPGDPGKGVSAEEISYAISQDGVNPPTSGWSGTRPTPKAGWYMWTRTRFKYTDNTYSAYFYLVAQQGKDAIVISDTAPANPTKGTLWQDSSVTPQIIKVFDGVAWGVWGMSLDNLLAPNILSENGVFKRLEGAEIVGSEFINPYTRSYNDGSFAQGTQRIGSAELYNSGVIKNSQGVATQSYEAIFSHQLVSMTRYSGESLGDQNELIAAMGLTFDSLTLNNQQTGFAGTLTAEMLYDTGWLKVTRLKGTAGDIYLKRYMNRILIRFDGFVWDGSANGASTSNAVAILPDKVREGFPQMFTVPVWIEGNATEKFQVENGRLYKLSNNSGNSRITAVGEVYI